MSAVQAQTLVIHLNTKGFAGHRDWRLPTVAELKRLVSAQCVTPAIDLKGFPNTPPVEFWSNESNGVEAEFVDFKDGFASKDDGNLPNAVRLVRTIKPGVSPR